MKQEYIETFLEVMNTRSLTRAAENLHLAQSTVSHNLNMLEEEVGKPLFLRARGIKTVEPTVYGEEFLSIAEHWMSLVTQTEAFKQSEHLVLDIAVMDSLNESILFPVIHQMMQEHPTIRVRTETASSTFIYKLAERREIDIGLVGYASYRPHINTSLAFEEKMCVVKNNTGGIPRTQYHPKDFDEKNEIRLLWGYEYEDWYDLHWNRTVAPCIETNSVSMQRHCLSVAQRWTVLPHVELESLRERGLQICDLGEFAPPNRKIYQISPRRIKPTHQAALEMFLKYLQAFVCRNQYLKE